MTAFSGLPDCHPVPSFALHLRLTFPELPAGLTSIVNQAVVPKVAQILAGMASSSTVATFLVQLFASVYVNVNVNASAGGGSTVGKKIAKTRRQSRTEHAVHAHAPRKPAAHARRYPPAPMPARVPTFLVSARTRAPRQISKYTKTAWKTVHARKSNFVAHSHTPNNPNRQRHAIESSRQERTGIIVLFLPDDACIRLLRPATVLATTRPRASRPLLTRNPLLPY